MQMNLKNQKQKEFLMTEKNILSATGYYQAIGQKNIAEAEKYLDEHVHFVGPFAEMTGKESVINAVKGFMTLFKTLTIRAACGSKDQVMLAYDLDCPAPFGIVRGAVLLTFKDGLIIGYELFYDARPFENKAKEIFSK